MYAHIENGVIDYQGSLPKNWRNVSALNLSNGDNDFLKTIGWFPLVVTDVTFDTDQTYDTDIVTMEEDRVTLVRRARDMIGEEKKIRNSRRFSELRRERNERLAETDFCALSDVTLSSEMASYRQDLRDLPATADMNTWGTPQWRWPSEPPLNYSDDILE